MDRAKVIEAMEIARAIMNGYNPVASDYDKTFALTVSLTNSIIIAQAIENSAIKEENDIIVADMDNDLDDPSVDIIHTSEGSYPRLGEPEEIGYYYAIFPDGNIHIINVVEADSAIEGVQFAGYDLDISSMDRKNIFPAGKGSSRSYFYECKWVKIYPQL
jgi:hypothetical protein